MSARIPRLPPSRISPRIPRYLVPRTIFDSPDRRLVILLIHQHIALNLLFALLAYFLFEFTSRCFHSYLDSIVLDIWYQIFNYLERKVCTSDVRFRVITTGRTEKRKFKYSLGNCHYPQSNDSRLLRTCQRIPEIPIKLSSSIPQLGRLSRGTQTETFLLPLPLPSKVSIKVPNRGSIPLWRNVVIHDSPSSFPPTRKGKKSKRKRQGENLL